MSSSEAAKQPKITSLAASTETLPPKCPHCGATAGVELHGWCAARLRNASGNQWLCSRCGHRWDASPSDVDRMLFGEKAAAALEAERKAEEEEWQREMNTLFQRKKGRPLDKLREPRRLIIRRVAARGVKGARYCEALDAAGLSTPVSWQQNEGCLKTYPQAYWHQDPVERAKWRQRIANEKSKMTH